ncbi:MAG TPA: lytic murein transglycosylase [Thermoleophilaceae bacterium]|nr:lytic murein transglycosylase [Thermoleophilaceae bacterium]
MPNFIIRKFRVPPFLLPIYQAAGIEYGVRWEVLAAINEIETDYGRNLNVSSAGAVGWMQFIPSTWRMYGTDANEDGRKDPYNPVDAIFAAARYLAAAGYEDDVRRAIFAYNHADWYVDSVLLRARLIAGVPADLVGSLTGLTEGRFPVYARAKYADDQAEGMDASKGIGIFAREGSPVVAVNDGVIRKVAESEKLGKYVVLEDVYGNRYTYAHLGSVASFYPVPKSDGPQAVTPVKADRRADPAPTAPASAGSQADTKAEAKPETSPAPADAAPAASLPVKERLFAHPAMPAAREAGGLEQVVDRQLRKSGGYETFDAYFSRPFGLKPSKVRLRRLEKGSRVIGGTVLGRVGRPATGAARLSFSIQPAGKGAPNIDPKPILDGWKLLEATAIYRASGRNVLYGKGDSVSIGQVLLWPKRLLERRVLSDERIELYDCGRDDIRSGQVDRRVLATLEYLAESGLSPTVTSLKCGHSFFTSSGNVSHHSSGNAVDIAKINGIPILGHQEQGGITEQTVRRLMRLQGTVAPAQIISLFELGGATMAMGDHADHIHVGFQPRTTRVFKPGQWTNLLDRLRDIENPVVPVKPSEFSLPVKKRAAAGD